jgi:hypothetical protein
MTAVALPRNLLAAKAWKAKVLAEVVWLLRKVGVGEEEADEVVEDVDVLLLLLLLLVVELGDGEVDVGGPLRE